MTEEITGSVGSYLMGMVVLAFFNSVITFILYSILGLPFPLLLAVVAFCLTIIPLVGTVIFWIVGTVVALFSSPIAALVFGVLYLIYMQLEAYVLTPKVMNKAIAVPGSLVVIGALVGGTLMGLLGALVAIPVTASILLIIKKVFIPAKTPSSDRDPPVLSDRRAAGWVKERSRGVAPGRGFRCVRRSRARRSRATVRRRRAGVAGDHVVTRPFDTRLDKCRRGQGIPVATHPERRDRVASSRPRGRTAHRA